jgi:hypothetical protein
MKRIAALLIFILAVFTACKKEPVPETGDLLITVEYDGFPEENVEVWLYDSYYGFEHYQYFDKQISDDKGEIFWAELLPGWYYFEAEITKPVDFTLYAFDSIEVIVNKQVNQRLILSPAK